MAAFFTSKDRSVSTRNLVKRDPYATQRKSVVKRMKLYEKGPTMRDLNLSNLELEQFPEQLLEDKRLQKYSTKMKTLSLNKNNIKLLPNNFDKYVFLKTFTISNNRLMLWPACLYKLTNLTQLDMSYNRLTDLEESFGALTNLRELSLAWNVLKVIPKGIFPKFGNMTALDLTGNFFTELPDDIVTMKNLRVLGCGYNRLQSVPENLGDLRELTTLNLSFNLLQSLPASIGRLERLKELQIWDNQITEIPAEIVRIFLLQGLHFSQNKLKRLEPESREGLDNLKFFKNAEVIDLEDNELESIGMTEGSEQFWKLFRSTDTLRLSYNRISSIGPCALKPLVSLTSLDLASNRLEELPECLSILSGLVILDVSCNSLTNSPTLEKALSNFPSLQCLNIGCNKLTTIPKAVGTMKDLIWLNLFSNEIEVIDETVFAGLKQYFVPSMFAKSIRLSYNKIKKFPEVLCKMEYLQELHLAGNELTEIPSEISKMKEMIVLSFAGNRGELTIPESIVGLAKLRKLYLRGSSIQVNVEALLTLNSLVEIDFPINFSLEQKDRSVLPIQIPKVFDDQVSKRFSHCCAKMASQKNEDRYAIQTPLIQDQPNIDYYGVFDGHAGAGVSQYCANYFHKLFAKIVGDMDLISRFPQSMKTDAHSWTKKKAISSALLSWGGSTTDVIQDQANGEGSGKKEKKEKEKEKEKGKEKKKEKVKEDGKGKAPVSSKPKAGIFNPYNHTNASKEIANALHETFVQIDKNMRQHFTENNIALSQGSTGVVAVVWGQTLFIGNAGDARCVLGTATGEVYRMSVDHTPQERSEAERVADAHGTFVVDSLAGRTLRIFNAMSGAQLAVSRALGDFEFGEVVTAAPTLNCFDLSNLPPPQNGMHNVLILACDGIWDVLKDKDAIDIVRRAGTDMQLASVMLRDFAYLRDSGDDLTVVAVLLDQ